MTSTTFEPAALQANSMLPNMSSSAMLPATRPLKISPMPKSRISSAGARESTQLKTIASRILSLRSRLSFAHEIAMQRFARPEAFVASFHLLKDSVRCHLVTLLFGKVCVSRRASQASLYYSGRWSADRAGRRY